MKRRILSVLLMLSLLISIFPTVVFAVDTPTGSMMRWDGADGAIPEGFQGQVVTLTKKTTDSGEEYYGLTIGMYNIPQSNTWAIRIKYDTDIVTFCDENGATEDEILMLPIEPTAETVYWENIQRSMLQDTLKEQQINAAIAANPTHASFGFADPLAVFVPEAGVVQVEIPIKNTFPSGTKTFIKGTDDSDGTSYTPPADTLVKMYTMYFKLNEGKTINENTFTLYPDKGTDQAGAKTVFGAKATSYGACFMDFPQAEKPLTPVDVTFNVTATAGSSDFLTNAPAITITAADGVKVDGESSLAAYPGGFSATEAGALTGKTTAGGNATLIEGSKLKLYPGDYTWTVTPASGEVNSDGDAYTDCSGDFTVAADTPQTVNMYAMLATVEPQTYVLTVLNDAGIAVSGAEVTVSGTGLKGISTGGSYVPPAESEAAEVITKSAVTDSNGRVAISAVPNKDYDVTISGTGYGTQTGKMRTLENNVFTLSGGVNTDSTGNVVMSTPKTSFILNIKDSTGAVQPDATVTVNWAGTGSSPIGPTRVQADSDGNVTLRLPDGKYTYTVSAPGKDDVKYTLDIESSESGGTKTTTVTVNQGEADEVVKTGTATGGADVAITDAIDSKVGEAISDMYYAVEGKWKDPATKTEMEVTVSVVNAPTGTVLDGTFGFQYDTTVFDAAQTTFTPDDTLINVPTKDGDGWFFTNPTSDKNDSYAYHVFYWKAGTVTSGNFTEVPIGGGSTPVKIATYTLKVNQALADQGVDAISAKMNDKTLSCRSFQKTTLPDEYKTVVPNLNANELAAHWAQHWQNADDSRRSSTSWQFHALDAQYALDGGFYQVRTKKDTGATTPQDIRMQITFDDSNVNKAVQFNVVDVESAPIDGATVTLMLNGNPATNKDGDPVVGTTDEFGKVTIQLPNPNETGYAFIVDGKGYKSYPEDTDTYPNGKPLSEYPNLDDVITVVLNPDNAPDVIVRPADQVTLLGSNKFNVDGTNYIFNVEAKPGYVLTNDPPKLKDITLEVYKKDTNGDPDDSTKVTIDGTNLSWNAEENHFEIKPLSYNEEYVIVIQVAAAAIEKKTDGYKVNVRADAAGGYFNVDVQATGSTFDKTVTDNTTKLNTVVETLAADNSTSSTYHFYANEPADDANKDLKAQNKVYEGFVINQLLVNGAPVNLTDAERIHGVSERLLGITKDQDITVTYMKAKIDAKDTETPGDDEILKEPAPTPIGDAIVTVVVGSYGSVTVGSNPAQNGPGTKDYTVTAGGNFEMTVTANTSVVQPDNTTADYEIDKVIVMDADGTLTTVYDEADPSAADTAKWDTAAGKLTLSAITAGDHKVVMVTFKNVAGETMQAMVQTVNIAGNGNIAQSGLLPYTIGDEPVFTLTPDASWDLSELKVKEPEASELSKKRYAVQGQDESGNTIYTYKMDALKAGTTVLSYEFKETAYDVRLTVHYAMNSSSFSGFTPVTDVSISYVRMSGGDGSAKTGTQTYNKSNISMEQEYALSLPAGKWTLTVSKPGYLDFVITDFIIKDDGTVEGDGTTNTKINTDDLSGTSSIVFGQLEGDGQKLHLVAPVIGDADHDNVVISIGDISQVNNGLISGSTQASRDHADIDESGKLAAGGENLTVDMTYVVNSFGRGVTRMSYADFVKSATYEKA